MEFNKPYFEPVAAAIAEKNAIIELKTLDLNISKTVRPWSKIFSSFDLYRKTESKKFYFRSAAFLNRSGDRKQYLKSTIDFGWKFSMWQEILGILAENVEIVLSINQRW